MTNSIKIEWTGKRYSTDADEAKGIEAANKVLINGGSNEDAAAALFEAMTEGWADKSGVEFCTIINGEVLA